MVWTNIKPITALFFLTFGAAWFGWSIVSFKEHPSIGVGIFTLAAMSAAFGAALRLVTY